MAEDQTTLQTLYAGWDEYQRQITMAIAPLSSEQLELRAAPHLRPIWVLAAHIVAARVYWFHGFLGEGDADVAVLSSWDDDGQPMRSASELVGGLERSWQLVQESIRRWTPTDLAQIVTKQRRGREAHVSR